jgi:hypothetical protein
MSLLAHATFAAPGFEAEKRTLAAKIQAEIHEAKNIRAQTGCTWTEALHLAREDRHLVKLAELYRPYDD